MTKRKRKPMRPAEMMTDTITVDNPAEYAERSVRPKVEADRALRDDPIGQMHARGHLGRRGEDADGRLARARMFQETWEASGRGGIVRSIDWLGGPGGTDPSRRSGFTDRRKVAGNALDRWQRQLGESGYSLLVLVLIDKRSVTEAARIRHGMATKATITFTGHRLRECLDGL